MSEPPPIPARREPPPIPGDHVPPSLAAKEVQRPVTFVIDGSRATQSVVIPAPRAQRPTSGHVHRETPIVPWITIITSLFCAGLVLMGMIAPQFMKWPWFLGANHDFIYCRLHWPIFPATSP